MTDGDLDRAAEATDRPLLEVRDLKTHYPITEGIFRREVGRVKAVDGVSFQLDAGEALGIVGESGSGKTTTALSILGLEAPTHGDVVFDGQRVSELSGAALRAFRRRAQLVVQDPNEAFNPRMTVGEAVAEPLSLHGMRDADRRRRIVADLLERVGLSAHDLDRYPHEFSGGEKQRIAIARALVLNPDLIVADEPTSALDGRVQADVLALLDDVRREFDIAVLFISHDIDVVRRFCDRVAVMYLGEIVETGPIEAVLSEPAHPYTRLLLGSVPSLDPADRTMAKPLTDTIPDPSAPPAGCRFHTRCPERIPPDEVTLTASVWQAVAAFELTLRTGELPA
ncbi:MAG: ABC transporter ATP-binding protein, partial [Halobacteriota archaeon]